MKKMKILFQGDSITEAGRIREEPHDLGKEGSYALYASKIIEEKYPEIEFDFINLGIGHSQTKHLLLRLESDFIDIKPDIISILIGINDVLHYSKYEKSLPNELFEKRYRDILKNIKERTNAKIMVIEPYLLPIKEKLLLRKDLNMKIDIVRKLALEYADVYLPIDGLFYAELVKNDPATYASDGVHPTAKGAMFIAKLYAEYVSKIIE